MISPSDPAPASDQPLASLDEWEDFLKDKYPAPAPAPARGTPNPSFRRVEAQVFEAQTPLIRVQTVIGRY